MKPLIYLILFLFMINIAFAVSPFLQAQESSSGITIIYPKFELYSNQNFTLHIHVYNSTNFLLTNTTTACVFHFYNHTGNHIYEDYMTFDSNTVDFYYNIDAVYLHDYNVYTYLVHCNNTKESGFISAAFEVTPNAHDITTGDTTIAIIILMPLLIAFLLLYWGNSLSEEHEPLKWFVRLLSLFMVFILYVGLDIMLNTHPEYLGLASLFNIFAFKWIFYTVMAAFLVYIIYKVFDSMNKKKQHDFEQGVIK